MSRATSRGLEREMFTDEEVEVLAEALDEYQQAARYAGGLSNGGDRTAKLRKARVATRLVERAENEQARRAAENPTPREGET